MRKGCKVASVFLAVGVILHAQGIISTVAGNGTPGNSGDGGPATSALIGFPQGLAVDQAGNLYIADAFFNVIRKVDAKGIISTVAGGAKPHSFSCRDSTQAWPWRTQEIFTSPIPAICESARLTSPQE